MTTTTKTALDEAVHLLKTIGLDITYTDDGLRVIAAQIVRMGHKEAFDAIQGMRGLTLDGPHMQVHAENRIQALITNRWKVD